MKLPFTKMHGCGNDYVYIDGSAVDVPAGKKAELVRRLSDRHFGIGGDGVIFINPSAEADFEMEMYNADGSRAEMCGNGIRCVAKYVYDARLTERRELDIVSAGKNRHIVLQTEDGRAVSARVDMGRPELRAEKIPVTAAGERVIDEEITVNGTVYRMTCVSMGNPHAVVFTADVKNLPLAEIGPYFENHERFPQRINTEFVHVVDRRHVEMRVWERGTGETLACVSYPGYDNNRLTNTMDSAYFAALNRDKSRPLYSRATQEQAAPGSTIKPVIAVAGLEEGVISPSEIMNATGVYTEAYGSPTCWIYNQFRRSHGRINVVDAIKVSCNYYFYEVGFRLGGGRTTGYSSDRALNLIRQYASEFGLDAKSGLEVPESAPRLSDTDGIRSSIGQGNHLFTVSQLTRYIGTVANGGTTYDLTLLDKVTDSEGNTIEDYSTSVYNKIDISDTSWNVIREGLHEVALDTKAFQELDLSIAGKTGTAQQSKRHPNHALFVGYAPYENPEIAISIRITNGYTSANAAAMAADIFRYYFGLAEEEELLTGTASSATTEVIND